MSGAFYRFLEEPDISILIARKQECGESPDLQYHERWRECKQW